MQQFDENAPVTPAAPPLRSKRQSTSDNGASSQQESSTPSEASAGLGYTGQTAASSLGGEEFFGNTNYPGDIIDKTPLLESQYKTLPFTNSAQLIAAFDEQISAQSVTLHPWQLDTSVELCNPEKKPTAQHPIKYCLAAANSSGKDAFVISPFAVWFIITKVKSRVIITSSSGTQLTSQTEHYIRSLCQKVNEKFGCEVFRIRQRYIRCRWTDSEIRMFATDEAGKAEGYHPMEPNAEMCIIVNEGKSVTAEIHQALGRCSGYNYWLEVSSTGEPIGDFYFAYNHWKHTRQVTSYDCPHISEEEREEDKLKYGEHSAYYRSKHLALFTLLGGEVIIPRDIVDRLLLNPPQISFTSSKFSILRIGIDLSAGGDEVVIAATKGNKQVAEHTLRETDTTKTARWIDSVLTRLDVPKDYQYIFADDGGIGHAIIDMLKSSYGWINIKRIHNQSPAVFKMHYGNRGAEAWDRIKRLFEESIWNPTGMSTKCIEQLTSRKIKDKLVGAKMILQSKKEAKSHGFESPDRADAFILSLTGLTLEDFLKDAKVDTSVQPNKTPERVRIAQDQIEEHFDNKVTYASYDGLVDTTSSKRVFGSLRRAMRNS